MKTLLFIVLTLVPGIAISQNVLELGDGTSPNAEISDVSWIAGQWEGSINGGIIEEIWSEPLGPSMMGSFKMEQKGKIVFYEFMTIAETDENSLILKIKHFNEDLTGWEEKTESVEFPLVKLQNHIAYFSGLTFEKISEKEMNIYVLQEEGDKKFEMKFVYRKAD